MKKEKYISDRISYLDHGNYSTVIISTKIDRLRESLLLFWILCWTACGVMLIYELITGDYEEEMRITLLIFVAFWVYFEYRIGKVFLWRKWGMEFISLDEEELTYKRAIGRYGKAKRFYHEKIIKMKADEDRPKSAGMSIENSFWFLGGERVHFEYDKRHYKFGRQLSNKESSQLIGLLNRLMNGHRKRHEATIKSEKLEKTVEES